MKTIIVFVLSVLGVFYLRELMDEGNVSAHWLALGLGVLFIGWVGKQIWGDR
jgi:uncharacterized membrane protein YGL010W